MVLLRTSRKIRKARPTFNVPRPWKLSCAECGKSLSTAYNLRKHMEYLHAKADDVKRAAVGQDTTARVSKAEQHFKVEKQWTTHDAKHTADGHGSNARASKTERECKVEKQWTANVSSADNPYKVEEEWSACEPDTNVKVSRAEQPFSVSGGYPQNNVEKLSNVNSAGNVISPKKTRCTLPKPVYELDENGKMSIDPDLLHFYISVEIESFAYKSEEERKQEKIDDYWKLLEFKKRNNSGKKLKKGR